MRDICGHVPWFRADTEAILFELLLRRRVDVPWVAGGKGCQEELFHHLIHTLYHNDSNTFGVLSTTMMLLGL